MSAYYPASSTVLDFGCGDGCFIPSLSSNFDHVVGVDLDSYQISIAGKVVEQMGLQNVELIHNGGKTIGEVASQMERRADVLFLLEVLEHIGDADRQYESRIEFLKELSALADSAIITVPRMTGPSFLLQRVGLKAFSHDVEPLAISEVLRAGLLSDTEGLEKRWHNGHIGFNDKKFERTIRDNFLMKGRKRDYFQSAYHISLVP